MTKCKTCGHEIDTPKFIKVKLNGKMVEIESQIHNFNIAFKDIVIPKGMELLNFKEAGDLQNMPDVIEQIGGIDKGIFIQQWVKQNERKYCATAWLGCSSNSFYLYASNNLNGNNAARGVLFKKVKLK
jgi:hypothetical protein